MPRHDRPLDDAASLLMREMETGMSIHPLLFALLCVLASVGLFCLILLQRLEESLSQ